MGKVFYVQAVQGGARSGACNVFLNLPAAPYELLDAVEKLQPDEGASVPVEVDEFYRFDMLGEYRQLSVLQARSMILGISIRRSDSYDSTLSRPSKATSPRPVNSVSLSARASSVGKLHCRARKIPRRHLCLSNILWR